MGLWWRLFIFPQIFKQSKTLCIHQNPPKNKTQPNNTFNERIASKCTTITETIPIYASKQMPPQKRAPHHKTQFAPAFGTDVTVASYATALAQPSIAFSRSGLYRERRHRCALPPDRSARPLPWRHLPRAHRSKRSCTRRWLRLKLQQQRMAAFKTTRGGP